MYCKTLKLFVSVSVAALALTFLLTTVSSTGGSPSHPTMALDRSPAWAATQPPTLPFYIYLPTTVRNYNPACASEAPVLMWATSEEAVLLRWRQPCGCSGAATFNVYRERQLLAADIARITDEATALAMLGPDWAWITARYPEVTTVAELYAMLDDNPLLADQLANTHYRVALVLGRGYLDETATPGATYEYRVEAVQSEGTQLLGPVTITTGQITPLDPPANVQAVTVISPALQVSTDWVIAQQNRKADRKIYLAWDVPGSQGVEGWPATWNASYDVFRADSVRGPYVRINMQPDGEDRPVLPMPATTPTTTTTYTEYDYFYLDADPALAYGATYYYRVAARDLLGQPRRWPTDTVQFSEAISAIPVDTLPPETPQGLTATPFTASIVLTWTPQVADTTGYRLYRSLNMTASVTVTACSTAPETCWAQIGATAQSAFTDADVMTHTVYWYRVRAVDAAGNLSAWSEPVYGKVYDRIPPCAPHVTVEGTQIIVETCPEAPDVARHLLYCSFDGGPEMMITTVPTATGGVHVDLREYYTPPYPLSPVCRVQSVDQSGNRSPLVGAQVGLLCPTDPITPMTPIIMDIITLDGGVYGWTAQVQWATEPSPLLQEFRIYRYSEGEAPVVYTAAPDASRFLDTEVKPNQVYSYVVSAVRNAYTCSGQAMPEVQVYSQPRLYEVKPPLDCCPREQFDLVWDPSSGFQPGVGVYLQWHNPLRSQQERMLAIIYRSLNEDSDYVAITPAFVTYLSYYDEDAEHPFYWYVIVMLDMATGEVIAKTPPWSPATVAQVTDAPAHTVKGRSDPRESRLWSRFGEDTVPMPASNAPLAQWQGPPVADTFIYGNQPDTNYGDYLYMVEGFQSDTLNPALVPLVRFDLSAIPNGATINFATFGAYLEASGGWESVTVGLAPLTASWEEMTVTANNAPAVGAEYATQTVGSTSDTWYTWDVTSLVQEWHAGVTDNYGFALYSGPPSHSRRFTTREGAQPPYLLVDYTPLPPYLLFGTGMADAFIVEVQSYDLGSTLENLSGYGQLTVGGAPLNSYVYTVSFSNVSAHADGVVYAGEISVPLVTPLEVQYPGGLHYFIETLTVNEDHGYGDVTQTLPAGTILHFGGTPYTPLTLNNATIFPNLTYTAARPAWASSCADPTPNFYFEMNPLPLRIVPLGTVTFNHLRIELGDTCTQYEERFSGGSRPVYPNANANDGFLYNVVYTATQPTVIHPDGMFGTFYANPPLAYATAIPYEFALTVNGAITFALSANQIADGALHDVDLVFTYYTTHTVSMDQPLLDPIQGYVGSATLLEIGPGGSLYGIVRTSLMPNWEMWPILWAGGAFDLRNWINTLYIPPLQTPGLPAEAAQASHPDDPLIQPGLNINIGPETSTYDFTWYHCDARTPITFPEGIQTDLYVRRGGVSDSITATIELGGGGVSTSLYGYTTTLKTFRATFCDNLPWHTDIAGDLDLPWPADVIVPLTDMRLSTKGCVASSAVREAPLTLGYWQTTLHPTAAEFRPHDAPPPTHLLWLLGKVDVPHLSTSGTLGSELEPIPLETSFMPDGTFHAFHLVYDQAHYGFDGFDFLLSEVRLNDWTPTAVEPPEWQAAATLAEPPLCGDDPFDSRGFVALAGNLIVPYFGTLEGPSGARPELRVLGWDDYVGFTERPKAKRIWDLLVTEHTYDFDPVYAHHHTLHTGIFVDFRQDDFEVVNFDSAAVISPTQTGIYLGLSSGTAALRALAETTITPLPATLADPLRSTMVQQWVPKIWGDTVLGEQYVDVLEQIWDDTYHFTATTTKINGLGEDIPDEPEGGRTAEWLERVTTLKQIRGEVELVDVDDGGQVIDTDLRRLLVSTWFEARNPKKNQWIVRIDPLSFEINPRGDYILYGKNIAVQVDGYGEVKGDAILSLNLVQKHLEGGVILYDLDLNPGKVKRAGAVFGVGADLGYLGALVDTDINGEVWGGAFLFGVIEGASPVLRAMGFADLLDNVGITGEGSFAGGYIRVYGAAPLYNIGCLFRVSVGGEVAAWYFAPITEQLAYDRYGGRLRGYIYGTALCIVSARGDVTLELVKPGLADQSTYSFDGQLWVAGGIGFCEPNEWDAWENRWWDDNWCYTCGALVDVNYNDDKANDWSWDYDAECE